MIYILAKICQRWQNTFNRLFKLIIVCLVIIFSLEKVSAQGSSASVHGKVIDETGVSMPGVTILQKGTTNGTATDVDGKFQIQVIGTNSVLVFSSVGYDSKEINVDNQQEINVSLIPASKKLDEVVVVGYGIIKKSDVTGSIVSLKKEDLTPGANINVQQSIQGRVAGVQVYQKSGEPGGAMSVKIRGVSSITAGNDPLYVIDGMPMNNAAPVGASDVPGVSSNPNVRNPMNGINPSDIASIEVLKDASATAIYGARGSNGVILITTKKGASGGLKVNYNVQYGVSEASNKLKLLSGVEYRDVLNAIIDAGGGVPGERVANNVADVDWQKELRQIGSIQTHDMSFSGGKDNTKFYASIGYFGQNGVIKKSGTDRYTLRLNIENTVPKKYAFGINMNSSFIADKINSVGIGVNENGGALYSAIYYDPTYPVFDNQGNYNRSPFFSNTIDHPLALIDGQYSNANSYRTFASTYGEYFIIPSLSAKVRISGDVNTSRRNSWVDPKTIIGRGAGGIAQINSGNVNYYMGEATLNYNTIFNDDHSLNSVVGATYEHFGSESAMSRGQGYATPELAYDGIGTGNSAFNAIGSTRSSSVIVSFLGRVNYAYKNRYLLTSSIRADGSSRFGPNYRFGYFPSVAVAWKIHEESFLSEASFMDELKLRSSYGFVGSQAIDNYIYFSTYNAVSNGPVFNGVRNTKFEPSRVSNPNLKWESSRQWDIGIDFSFFDSRLSGSLEYYSRKTSDLLLNLPQPLSTGFAFKTLNIGSMRNTGIDLSLTADIIRKNKFTWTFGTVLSTVKNEVLSLGPLQDIFIGSTGFINNPGIIRPGESIGSYFGYKVSGVWQATDDFSGWSQAIKPGDLKFEDRDNNKVIDANDRTILGKSIPDLTFGITNKFTYTNFSLALFIEGIKGGSVLNAVAVDSYYPISFRRNRLAEPYLNRWTPTNPTNEYPSFLNPTSQGQQLVNSRTVEDASYLRLQSAQLSYTFKPDRGPVKNVQMFLTGQNLFILTKYTGIDPAASATGTDVFKIDYSTYPMTRTFLVGVNFQF